MKKSYHHIFTLMLDPTEAGQVNKISQWQSRIAGQPHPNIFQNSGTTSSTIPHYQHCQKKAIKKKI